MKLVMATLLCVVSLVGCGEPNCSDNFEQDCIAQCGSLGNCGFDPLCSECKPAIDPKPPFGSCKTPPQPERDVGPIFRLHAQP